MTSPGSSGASGASGASGGASGPGITYPRGYPQIPTGYTEPSLPLVNPSETVHIPPPEVPAVNTFTGAQLDQWIRDLIEGFLKQVVLAVNGVFTTGVEAFDQLGTWASGLLTNTWETLLELLDALFSGFDLEEFLQPLFDFLKWVWDQIGSQLQGLIEQVIDFLSPLMNPQQFVDLLKAIFNFFANLTQGFTGIVDIAEELFAKIPILGPLVAMLTGKDSSGDVDLDLILLGEWARTLENRVTTGVQSLTAAAEKLLAGIIPVGMISNSPTNLLSQGDFLTSSTVDPGNGWSWDGTRSRTGSGGCLKVDCSGSEQRIYCRQDIKVAAGDRLSLNGYVGTNNFTSGSIRLSIQPWAPVGSVMTAQTVVNGNARTTAAGTFQALPELTYTVPAGVTSIQVSLVVNCNSTCDVFFDDIRLTKTGVLQQDLVTNLIDAFNAILAGTGFFLGQGWTRLQDAVSLVTGTANDALNSTEETNLVLFENPEGGQTVVTGALDLPGIAGELGTAGSGGRMSKTSGTANLLAGPQSHVFANFYTTGTSTSDITYSTANGTFTVTHAGFYQVEIGFTVNASPGMAGAFNVAPAVGVGGTLNKIGSTAFGSYAFGAGGYARTAHSTFIVQLPSNGVVTAAYYNYFDAQVDNFFTSGATNTYFSIAMLNRSQDG